MQFFGQIQQLDTGGVNREGYRFAIAHEHRDFRKKLLRGRNSADYGCGLTGQLVLGISGYAVLG